MALKRRPLNNADLLQIKQYLAPHSVVNDASWPEFLNMLSVKVIARGEFLLRTGESPEEMGLVLKGILKTYYEMPDGSNYVRNFSSEGSLCGSFGSWLSGSASNVSIAAIEDTEIVTCSFSTFETLYAKGVCWVDFGRKRAERLLVLKERREAQLLMLSAKQRYNEFLNEFSAIQDRLVQRDVASYLGITPESLSRLKKQ